MEKIHAYLMSIESLIMVIVVVLKDIILIFKMDWNVLNVLKKNWTNNVNFVKKIITCGVNKRFLILEKVVYIIMKILLIKMIYKIMMERVGNMSIILILTLVNIII